MKRKFRSKIGLELTAPLIIIMVTVFVLMMMSGEIPWFALVVPVLTTLFIVYVFMTTDYTVEGDILKVRSGFLINKAIDIRSILKISETNDPSSAPATSIDRLRIEYGEQQSILISPREKQAFIDLLLQLNSKIELKYKKENR